MTVQNIHSTSVTRSTNSLSTGLYEQAMENIKQLKRVNGCCCNSSSVSVDTILPTLEETKGLLVQAAKNDPTYPGIYILMSEVEFLLGNTEAALAASSEAISLNPRFSDQYYKASDIYKFRIACRQYGKIIDSETEKDLRMIRELGNEDDQNAIDGLIQLRIMIDQIIFKHGESSIDYSDSSWLSNSSSW